MPDQGVNTEIQTTREIKTTSLTDDAELAELLLDDGVVGDGDPRALNLGVSALVDELSDGLEVDLAVGNVRGDQGEHLLRGLGHADKDTVVDLSQSEELEDLSGLGGNLRDTARAKGQKWPTLQNSKRKQPTPSA